MPASPLVHEGAKIMCPHPPGEVKLTATDSRVKVGGKAVVTQSDPFPVSGCPAIGPGGNPQPCLQAKWTTVASKVTVGGKPVVLKNSNGLCEGSTSPGPPNIVQTQIKVKGK